MSDLTNKTIVLGVTGGIAAYKAAELASSLVQRGAAVNVVMTQNATRFVQPLTFAALTGRAVHVDMFDPAAAGQYEHLSAAQKADLLLIAPATANVIAKIAAGLADDLLTAMVLACEAPLLIAPAMNSRMWGNAATAANIQTLQDRGVRIVGPEPGRLACGDVGPGRLASLDILLGAIEETLADKRDLHGVRILVTVGATREPLDPVRFLSNRSSGRMGFALAEAARDRGAEVTILRGATATDTPSGVEVLPAETAEEMCNHAAELFDRMEVVISAAAIADFRPARAAEQKIKKGDEETLTLQLERTPDLLAGLGKAKQNQLLVGFAAETVEVVENAKQKLHRKNLDLIVANDVTAEGAGFGGETNIVTLISRKGLPVSLPLMSKRQVAERILDEVSRMLKERRSALSPHTGQEEA